MAKGLRFKDAEKARDEITNDQLKRISKLYNDWADDIAKKAEQLKRKGTMSSELQERQMKELEQALRKASEQVANDVTKTVKDGMAKICQSVIAENADWMESLGFPKDVITAAFSSVPDNVVRNIVTGKIYDSGWSLSQSIWGDNEDTLAKIHEIVAGGMAENKPIYDIAKDLEQYVRPDARKQWNLRTKSGKMIYPKKVDYNAQRLARTLSQHAYQQTIKTTSTENPFIQKVKWHSSGNRVCEICKKRNGKIFPVDKLPMDHPNGFCIMEQLVDDNIDDRLIDWVNGKEDKELDGFAEKLGASIGGKDSSISESKVKAGIVSKTYKEFTNTFETDKELLPFTQKLWDKFDSNERNALYEYTIGSDSINGYLRGTLRKPASRSVVNRVNAIKSAIEKSELPFDMKLNRSIGNKGIASFLGVDSVDKINESLLGNIVSDKAFISTSAGDPIWDFEDSGFNLQILAPKGAKGIYAEPFAYYGGGGQKSKVPNALHGLSLDSEEQMEVILQAGTKFRVNEIKKTDKITTVVLEVIQ